MSTLELKKPGAAARPAPVRRLSSRDLLRNRNRLVIEHNGRDYTLTVTRNGKLILTG